MGDGPRYHVWVSLPFVDEPMPGLVLEWRQDEDGWAALVTYRDERNRRIVTDWIRVGQLQPAGAPA